MSGLLTATPRTHVRCRTDLAAIELVRIVMAQDWTARAGADDLLASTHGDVHLLRLLRARVARAILQRPTDVSARAAATLDLALVADDPGALSYRDRTRI